MKESLRLALQPSVVKRALKYAVVVGSVLITINHADALIKGALKIMAWTKAKTAVVGMGVLFAAGTITVTVK